MNAIERAAKDKLTSDDAPGWYECERADIDDSDNRFVLWWDGCNLGVRRDGWGVKIGTPYRNFLPLVLAEPAERPEIAELAKLHGGVYGTCDQGGCNNPADYIRDGLPACAECYASPRFNRGDKKRKSYLQRAEADEAAKVKFSAAEPAERAAACWRIVQDAINNSHDEGDYSWEEQAKLAAEWIRRRHKLSEPAERADQPGEHFCQCTAHEFWGHAGTPLSWRCIWCGGRPPVDERVTVKFLPPQEQANG